MLVLFFLAGGAHAVVVRDVWTGLAVPASVERTVRKGGTVYSIRAAGYSPLTFRLQGDPDTTTVWLVPQTPPPFPSFIPGTLTIRGVVSDPAGRPLAGVRINERVSTDRNGMFELHLPAARATHSALPRSVLRFALPGYRSLVREILIVEGSLLLKITLRPGTGEDTLREHHGQGTGNFFPEESSRPHTADLLIPPTVIRVGTNCTGRSCTSVQIMPLEYYVQSGLDEEWIASWPSHALRAGSVAYRTYGAWYTAHPLSGTYDICSNTFCQVWDGTDVYASVVDAVHHTTGILLSDNGTYAYAEYAAENNDCGCGDGYAGTGSTWPCIPDGVDAGHPCFGHGRGMCQWGTFRWAAQGKVWTWMAEHYYQPGGFSLASPVGLVSIDAFPDTLEPGDTLTLTATVISYAGDTLPHGMLGASLHQTVWVSDPDRDLPVTYAPGQQVFTRLFVIPDTLSGGPWQVYIGLWLDVDENARINTSGGDLPLALQPGPVLQVVRRTAVGESPLKFSSFQIRLVPGGVQLRSRIPRKVDIYRPDGRRETRVILRSGKPVFIPLPRGIFLLHADSITRRIVVP